LEIFGGPPCVEWDVKLYYTILFGSPSLHVVIQKLYGISKTGQTRDHFDIGNIFTPYWVGYGLKGSEIG